MPAQNASAKNKQDNMGMYFFVSIKLYEINLLNAINCKIVGRKARGSPFDGAHGDRGRRSAKAHDGLRFLRASSMKVVR